MDATRPNEYEFETVRRRQGRRPPIVGAPHDDRQQGWAPPTALPIIDVPNLYGVTEQTDSASAKLTADANLYAAANLTPPTSPSGAKTPVEIENEKNAYHMFHIALLLISFYYPVNLRVYKAFHRGYFHSWYKMFGIDSYSRVISACIRVKFTNTGKYNPSMALAYVISILNTDFMTRFTRTHGGLGNILLSGAYISCTRIKLSPIDTDYLQTCRHTINTAPDSAFELPSIILGSGHNIDALTPYTVRLAKLMMSRGCPVDMGDIALRIQHDGLALRVAALRTVALSVAALRTVDISVKFAPPLPPAPTTSRYPVTAAATGVQILRSFTPEELERVGNTPAAARLLDLLRTGTPKPGFSTYSSLLYFGMLLGRYRVSNPDLKILDYLKQGHHPGSPCPRGTGCMMHFELSTPDGVLPIYCGDPAHTTRLSKLPNSPLHSIVPPWFIPLCKAPLVEKRIRDREPMSITDIDSTLSGDPASTAFQKCLRASTAILKSVRRAYNKSAGFAAFAAEMSRGGCLATRAWYMSSNDFAGHRHAHYCATISELDNLDYFSIDHSTIIVPPADLLSAAEFRKSADLLKWGIARSNFLPITGSPPTVDETKLFTTALRASLVVTSPTNLEIQDCLLADDSVHPPPLGGKRQASGYVLTPATTAAATVLTMSNSASHLSISIAGDGSSCTINLNSHAVNIPRTDFLALMTHNKTFCAMPITVAIENYNGQPQMILHNHMTCISYPLVLDGIRKFASNTYPGLV